MAYLNGSKQFRGIRCSSIISFTKKCPKILKKLQQEILNRTITAIIPTIAISEILWKMRRIGEQAFKTLKKDYINWKKSPNIIIDNFDVKILDLMMENKESYELHDEIIAYTCRKYNTTKIYTKDLKFKEFWSLNTISW